MLENHYLVEDYKLMNEHRDNIIQQSLKGWMSANNAEFSQNENIIASIHHSLLMLQALNAKKLQREAIESGRVQHI